MPRPFRVLVLTVALAGALAVAPQSALAAKPAALPALSSAADAPTVIELPLSGPLERTTLTYGTTPAAGELAVGIDTLSVVLTPGFAALGPEVSCSGDALEGAFVDATGWSETSTLTVDVRPGAIEVGGRYSYSCSSGEVSSVRTVWNFVGVESAGQTVALDADDANLVSRSAVRDFNAEGSTPRTVNPGDRVALSGALGTWPSGVDADVEVRLRPGDDEVPDLVVSDVEIASDGSRLAFTLPADLPAPFRNSFPELLVRVSSATVAPGGALVTDEARWFGAIAVPGESRAPSTVRATLDRTTTLSVLQPRLTVTVATGVVPATAGSITVEIDGRTAVVQQLPSADRTRITVLLPRLARGTHEIQVRYTGSTNVEPSQSGVLRLRVLV